ncbi:MAG TPA: hypothetical protein VNO30_33660 [Kofleriaceae bacterium]|nr:hypothetical protein [Kofleriaceae bacterium]
MRLAIIALVLLAAPAAALADDPTWSGPPGGGPPGMTPYAQPPYAPPPYAPPPYAQPPYAQPPYAPAPFPPKVTREVSYGHQTLISDGIAAVLITGAFLQDNPYSGLAMIAGGVNVYAFGAPIVHWANGQGLGGFKSLGLRIGLPWLGMMAGNLIGPKNQVVCDSETGCPDSDESTIGLAIGAGLGAIAAAAIDARYIARKRVAVPAPSFAPAIGYDRSGFSVGLTGSF